MSGCLAVVDDRVTCDDDAIAGTSCTPAEVDVVTEEGQCRVKSVEYIPHVPTNEHASTAHGKDITSAVMLTLIELTWFKTIDQISRSGDGDTHRHQLILIVQFWSPPPMIPTAGTQTTAVHLG